MSGGSGIELQQSVKLSKRTVDAAQPGDTDYTIWDTEVGGFGLRVRPSGRKVYCFKYRVGGGRSGKVRKPAIGVHGAITAEQARAIARDWAAEVRKGGDPSGERQTRRNAPDMDELFDKFLKDHAELHKKESSLVNDRSLIGKHLRPHFAKMKVADVTRADVDRFHKSLSHFPYRANRAVALLSKAFNLAETWGWRPDQSNPCRLVKKFKETARTRFLSPAELARLGEALAKGERGEILDDKGLRVPMSLYVIAALRLLILTGARRGEILGLQWDWVNLDAGRLELPDSKTGAKFVYLPKAAIDLLRKLPRVEDNPYVIVGGKEGTALVNLKDPWGAIRKEADIEDVRIHDLRHSFASVGADGGASLPMIGALLGHSNPTTTARYAHLADDPLRNAADAIGDVISTAMRLRESDLIDE